MKSTISVDKLIYADMLRMVIQLISVSQNHKNEFTSGENALVKDLRSLIEIEVGMYSKVGLPDERQVFQPIEKLMRSLL